MFQPGSEQTHRYDVAKLMPANGKEFKWVD
jgi:hypothetical protein